MSNCSVLLAVSDQVPPSAPMLRTCHGRSVRTSRSRRIWNLRYILNVIVLRECVQGVD